MTNKTNRYGVIEFAHREMPKFETWKEFDAWSKKNPTQKNLIRVPHNDSDLIVAEFGPQGYDQSICYNRMDNLSKMAKTYWNSEELPNMSFRPATTSESISAARYDLEGAKDRLQEIHSRKNFLFPSPTIFFYNRPVQAGRIVKWNDGIYINPLSALKDKRIDETALRELKDKAKSSNGIKLGDNDFAFVPYESFEVGIQGANRFAEGGLARGLEHSYQNVAKKLQFMTNLCKDAVYVKPLTKSSHPVEQILCIEMDLEKCSPLEIYCLDNGVDMNKANGIGDDFGCGGFAYGVLKEREEA